MPRKTLVDLQLETMREWQKYRENPICYAKKIKQVVRELRRTSNNAAGS